MGVRIAFESVCPGGVVDIEQVLISILESQEETGPMSAPNRIETGLVLLPTVEVAGNVDCLARAPKIRKQAPGWVQRSLP